MCALKVLDIQRMSSEDGPGLRTTVFLKGCPLRCAWCHNPESIAFQNQVVWNGARCMGCGSCVAACPHGNIALAGDGLHLRRENCAGCYACCDACPTGALEGKGTDWQPQALCRELLKDAAYFGADGGVTLSGGEALAQEESIRLLELLKAEGVSVAVDTCGQLPEERLRAALSLCDILLFDVKIADNGAHKAYTGHGNGKILANLARAGEWAERGGRLWIRTPVIPGATDSLENITAIGKLLCSVPAIERWELCAFNNLCESKYRSLEREWEFCHTPLVSKEAMAALLQAARETGACADTRATGALRENL